MSSTLDDNKQNISSIASLLGKLGGERTKNTMPKDYYKRISRLGVEARLNKKKYPIDKAVG